MKRLAIVLLCLCLLCVGCGKSDDGQVELDVTEDLYVTTVNAVYNDYQTYVGERVRIEGVYGVVDTGSAQYHWVYRQGPGCCGTDGAMCGFEFTYNGETPEINDWIQVIGILESYKEDGSVYLSIKAESVTVMDVRGLEIVSR
ncbi:MAG TPA: hypothetical protein P5116_02330 [Eubacteriales bacterium]|nr:hypothetical protein [Clostridia bacterium]HRV72700.1 hypothetical protein [Eubacteriales bacterium]